MKGMVVPIVEDFLVDILVVCYILRLERQIVEPLIVMMNPFFLDYRFLSLGL
jgi:hypothetical protein